MALFSSSVWMMIKFDSSDIDELEGVPMANSNSSMSVNMGDGEGTNVSCIHFVIDIFKEDFHTQLPIKGSMTLVFAKKIASTILTTFGSSKFPVGK